MDGETVVDGRAAMFQIAQLRPGHLLRVNLDRDGTPIELEAVVGRGATAAKLFAALYSDRSA